MTSLLLWVAVDPRGPASVNLVSDSRISWGKSGIGWEAGKKLFVSSRYPEAFGYCGSTLFTTNTISQILTSAEDGALYNETTAPDTRFQRVSDRLTFATASYPPVEDLSFQVVYAVRAGNGTGSSFEVFLYRWSAERGPETQKLDLPEEHSSFVGVYGSGAASLQEALATWRCSPAHETSRGVFWAFCDSLRSGADPLSGGPPQVVRLMRVGLARHSGVIWNGRRFFCGLEVAADFGVQAVPWTNERFEVCDGETGQLLKGASPRPRPSS